MSLFFLDLSLYSSSMNHLERPNTIHASAYLDLLHEWGLSEAIPTSPRALFRGSSFEEFLALSEQEPMNTENEKVPATLYFYIDDAERILGAIHIRHSIDLPSLRNGWGHIGYGIRPSERGQWYATDMLRLWLIEAKKLWLSRVMLGCYDENIASRRTIEKNGGIFERMTEFEGNMSRIYWIDIDEGM